MSLLQVYQGDTKTVSLAFTNSDGTPFNISGSTLLYTVQRSFSDPTDLIFKTITGHVAPASGLSQMLLTSGDTNICANDYLAMFTLIDSGSGITTIPTDGLRILPSLRGTA